MKKTDFPCHLFADYTNYANLQSNPTANAKNLKSFDLREPKVSNRCKQFKKF